MFRIGTGFFQLGDFSKTDGKGRASRRFYACGTAMALALALAPHADAATFTVRDETDLLNALLSVAQGTGSDNRIVLAGDVALAGCFSRIVGM